VAAALQAATVSGDAEGDVPVLKLMWSANVNVCLAVLASLDDLSGKISGVELAGGGFGGIHVLISVDLLTPDYATHLSLRKSFFALSSICRVSSRNAGISR
jgi:hypothetical protein